MIRVDDLLVSIGRVEMENTGLVVIDPDNGVVVAHD
jgi:hypothetical protein